MKPNTEKLGMPVIFLILFYFLLSCLCSLLFPITENLKSLLQFSAVFLETGGTA